MAFFKKKRAFPTLAVILLVLGAVWLLNDMGYLAIKVSWVPLVLVIVAAGMIINRYRE
jgi:hypothetical protein